MATKSNLDDLFEIASEEEPYILAKKYVCWNESFGNALLKHFKNVPHG